MAIDLVPVTVADFQFSGRGARVTGRTANGTAIISAARDFLALGGMAAHTQNQSGIDRQVCAAVREALIRTRQSTPALKV